MARPISDITYSLLVRTLMAMSVLFAACTKNPSQDNAFPMSISVCDSLLIYNPPRAYSYADSMYRDAEAARHDDEAAYYISQKATAAFYCGWHDRICPAADSAMSLALSAPSTALADAAIATAAKAKGAYFEQFDARPDSAVFYMEKGLQYTSRQKPAVYVSAMANLADAYKLNSKFAKAADLYYTAILTADSMNVSENRKEMLYSGLAGTYTTMRDFDQAAVWWDKTMELYPWDNTHTLFANLNNLGNHYYLSGQYDKSLETFRRLSAKLDSLDASDIDKAFCKINTADVLLRLERPDSARMLMEQAKMLLGDALADTPMGASLATIEMRMWTQLQHFAQVEYLVANYPVDSGIRDDLLLNRLEALSDYYSHTRQWHDAYVALQDYHALKDSLISVQVRQAAEAIRLRFERDHKLVELERDKAQALRRQSYLWMVISAILALFGGAVAIGIWYRRRIRCHEQRMLDKIIELRMESVRGRITPHFIYNALNQELLARDRGEPSRLPAIVGLLRRQQYLAETMETSLAEELAFLKDYVDVQSLRSAQPFDFKLSVDDTINPVEVTVPSMALQILAENAFKHGFPTLPEDTMRRLDIKVVKKGNALEMRVANNLRPGLTAREMSQTGLGLRIITETLQYINSRKKEQMHFGVSLDSKEGIWSAIITLPMP